MPAGSSTSSASVAGIRRTASSTGRSSSTSTSHVQGTLASERVTCATASNPSGGGTQTAVDERRARHPVDPERAQVVAQVIVSGEVPTSRVDDEAVRTDFALRLLPAERAVSGAEPAAATDRVGEQEHGSGVGGRAARRGREAERLLQRLDLTAERRRQHAVDLRERAVDGSRRAVGSGAARREEAEHDDDRLLVAEHQRWQPVPRPDPVPAPDAALPLDGDPEALQHADVAPHRARVDLEPAGDLAPGRERPRLEQFEQLEQARRRRGHADSQARIAGGNRPI